MTGTMLRAVIKGTGSALPKERVSNADLAERSTLPTNGSPSAPE